MGCKTEGRDCGGSYDDDRPRNSGNHRPTRTKPVTSRALFFFRTRTRKPIMKETWLLTPMARPKNPQLLRCMTAKGVNLSLPRHGLYKSDVWATLMSRVPNSYRPISTRRSALVYPATGARERRRVLRRRIRSFAGNINTPVGSLNPGLRSGPTDTSTSPLVNLGNMESFSAPGTPDPETQGKPGKPFKLISL